MAVKAEYVKPGTVLIADDGMSCLHPGTRCFVKADHSGLFVDCTLGRHALETQKDLLGEVYVGFYMLHVLPCGCASDGSIICTEHSLQRCEAKKACVLINLWDDPLLRSIQSLRDHCNAVIKHLNLTGPNTPGFAPINELLKRCDEVFKQQDALRRG